MMLISRLALLCIAMLFVKCQRESVEWVIQPLNRRHTTSEATTNIEESSLTTSEKPQNSLEEKKEKKLTPQVDETNSLFLTKHNDDEVVEKTNINKKQRKNHLHEGVRPPSWNLNGENPLKQARKDGKVVLLALWKASCPFCQSQAAKLYQWYNLLKEDSFKVVVINKIGDEKSLLSLDRLSRKSFYLYQDDEDTKVWDVMKGDKDSLYIFNKDGELTKQFHNKHSSMGRKNQKCKDANENEVIKHLLQELRSIPSKDTAKCDDSNFIKYKKIVKGFVKKNKHNKTKSKNGGKSKNKKQKKKMMKRRKKNRKNRKDRKKESKKNKFSKSKNKKNKKKNKKDKRKRKERKMKRKQRRLKLKTSAEN